MSTRVQGRKVSGVLARTNFTVHRPKYSTYLTVGSSGVPTKGCSMSADGHGFRKHRKPNTHALLTDPLMTTTTTIAKIVASPERLVWLAVRGLRVLG